MTGRLLRRLFLGWHDRAVERAAAQAEGVGYRRGLADARKPLQVWASEDGTEIAVVTMDGTYEERRR